MISNSLRLEIGSTIFALITVAVICLGTHLLFRSYGFTEAYLRPGVIKTLLVLATLIVWQVFTLWKKYRAETEVSRNPAPDRSER